LHDYEDSALDAHVRKMKQSLSTIMTNQQHKLFINQLKMKKETIEKGNKLLNRIKRLSKMKQDFITNFNYDLNISGQNYDYHFRRTDKKDNMAILNCAMEAMYNKVCLLLDEAEKELESLK